MLSAAVAPYLRSILVKLGAGGADLLIQCAPFGLGDRTRGILRLDVIIHERIQKERT
jgi:hypothetical protein